MQKIFYNITRIENGWLLQHSVISCDRTHSVESYFPNLSETLSFIDDHFQGLIFDGASTSPGITDAEAEDAEVNFYKQQEIGERRKKKCGL